METSLPSCPPALRIVGGLPDARQTALPVCIVACVDNYLHLALVYGDAVAAAVRAILHERLRELCIQHDGVVTLSGARFLLLFETQGGADRDAEEAMWSARVLAALEEDAIPFATGVVVPAVSAHVAPFANTPFDIEDGPESAVPPPEYGKTWRGQYRHDMELAAGVYGALANGALTLCREPVFDLAGHGRVLYHELLLRNRYTESDWAPSAAIGALERLGMMRRLDRWVVSRALDELDRDADARLGCNISAQSAVVDVQWRTVFARLRERPDLATRLTIEITETASLPDLAGAAAFVRELRVHGCRIALDDLGAKHNNIDVFLELEPDIAKIGTAYLFRARATSHARSCLARLIDLASTVTATVVVEGIETAGDLRLARECGASWGQGYLMTARKGIAAD